MKRCSWVGDDPIYKAYHDTEWGVPEYDSRALWEKLILDGFQAGLSWITILRKRDAFRVAFVGFDPVLIASWDDQDVERLMQNAGIVRNRAKIVATIANARAYLELEKSQSFADFMWAYVGGSPLLGQYEHHGDVPTQSPLSQQISKDLKKLGFKFVGPTIVYAWMEACGLFNNHTRACHKFVEG